MVGNPPRILQSKPLRQRLAAGLPILLTSLAALTLPGCIVVGGTNERETPTTGQQLIDLKRAADEGAISREEYDATKAKILKGESAH